MKENVVKGTLTIALGGLSAYFQVLLIPLILLLCVMIIDYITGLTAAGQQQKIESKVAFKGVVKKLCYFIVVAVAGVVDWLITSGLSQAGINIKLSFAIGVLVTVWLIITELISILENLSKIGVPLPKFLMTLIQKLKTTVEKNGEEIDNE